MKKVAMAAGAALLAGFSGGAAAQSAVTLYGLLDIGYVRESGGVAGAVNKITSGMSNGSRFGFKGSEDLGGGLSAQFLMEGGVQLDIGASGQGGALFGRQIYVGLSSTTVGTLLLGRQYTPEYGVLVLADPFATGLAGDAANLLPNTGNASSRMDNAVKYISPNLSGFTGELAYGTGEVTGANKAGQQWGAAVGYTGGPFAVKLGYHLRNNDTALVQNTTGRTTLLAATYNFDVFKAHLGYGVNKGQNSSPLRNAANPYGAAVAPVASNDSRDLLLGVSVPLGAHTLLASYIRKDDKRALNQDATQWALGYRYALSKRTDLYSSYAHINNKNGAGYTVGSSIEAGSGNTAFSVGMRHVF